MKNSGKKILIAGGSGLIGSRLIRLLKRKDFHVALLSTSKDTHPEAEVFSWNPGKDLMEEGATDGVDILINLSGASLGSKRWTKARREAIVHSRVNSGRLLLKKVMENEAKPEVFISMSAVGYYGSQSSDRIFTEKDNSADDFLGQTCLAWERTTDPFEELGIRTVILRSGIVLSNRGGALPQLLLPLRFGLAPRLGRGHQYVPWIHEDDLCSLILFAIENQELKGAYNAVAPEYVTQADLMKELAAVRQKPAWAPGIPASLLIAVLGQRASLLLEGSRISPQKIQETGFEFEYEVLNTALHDFFNS